MGRITAPQKGHILLPGACEYVTDVAQGTWQMQLKILTREMLLALKTEQRCCEPRNVVASRSWERRQGNAFSWRDSGKECSPADNLMLAR